MITGFDIRNVMIRAHGWPADYLEGSDFTLADHRRRMLRRLASLIGGRRGA